MESIPSKLDNRISLDVGSIKDKAEFKRNKDLPIIMNITNQNQDSNDHNSDIKKQFTCIHTFKGPNDKIVSLIQ